MITIIERLQNWPQKFVLQKIAKSEFDEIALHSICT